jgi:hypothetical protein
MSGHFLNLSNHATSGWSVEQRGAAARMGGEVLDLAFPVVDPGWAEEEVAWGAREFVEAREELWGSIRHAMVAGEPLMVLHLVAGLQERGIQCWTATTERRTEVRPDGTKVSVFGFVRFRAWPRVRLEESGG